MLGLRLSVPNTLQLRMCLSPVAGKAPPSLICEETLGTVILDNK